MKGVTRREAVVAAALALAGPAPGAEPAEGKPASGLDEKAERQHVLACGFTETEADCWVAVAQAAGRFFALPKLHPMDDHEVAQAIHILQNKLLSRPVYRRYKGLAQGEKK